MSSARPSNWRQINDRWIRGIIQSLNEGGSWGWLDEGEIYIKKGDKLVPTTLRGLLRVRNILTRETFEMVIDYSNKNLK